MATVKRYSPSRTDGDAIGSNGANSSSVYSLTGDKGYDSANTPAGSQTLPDGSWCTPGYQYADGEGMVVGRTMDVFVNKPGLGNPTATASGLPTGTFDNVTQAAGVPGTPQNTTVICTTTSTTDGSVGAGIIVKFTTTDEATPRNPAAGNSGANYTCITFGQGYKDNDTLEIDGFPGSVLTVAGLTS